MLDFVLTRNGTNRIAPCHSCSLKWDVLIVVLKDWTLGGPCFFILHVVHRIARASGSLSSKRAGDSILYLSSKTTITSQDCRANKRFCPHLVFPSVRIQLVSFSFQTQDCVERSFVLSANRHCAIGARSTPTTHRISTLSFTQHISGARIKLSLTSTFSPHPPCDQSLRMNTLMVSHSRQWLLSTGSRNALKGKGHGRRGSELYVSDAN